MVHTQKHLSKMVTQKFLKFAALLLIEKFHSNLWDFIFYIIVVPDLQKKKWLGWVDLKAFIDLFLEKLSPQRQ